MCHYEDLSKTIINGNCVLRSNTVHAYHLKCIEDDLHCKSVYGVTGPCAFNKLLYFDTTKAFPLDLMNYFLGGVVPFLLKSVLKALQ